MYLSKLIVKNLRCFAEYEINLASGLNLLEGLNGSGKTTLLEALYYLCFLRSFRTNLTQELIRFDSSEFFIKVSLQDELAVSQPETLQVGFSAHERIIRLNGQKISSFKQLIQNYRVVLLTEDDLDLIKAGPEVRRSFIDQYIYLEDLQWAVELRTYKKILDQRNAVLRSNSFDRAAYLLWTKQLNHQAQVIRERRIQAIEEISKELNSLVELYFDKEFQIEFKYEARAWQEELESKERILNRSLCGAHLDDFRINMSFHSSRKYASRGQQKLIVILMKITQIILLKRSFQGAILFLLDDFATDLDQSRLERLISLLLKLEVQLLLTAPALGSEQKAILFQNSPSLNSVLID